MTCILPADDVAAVNSQILNPASDMADRAQQVASIAIEEMTPDNIFGTSATTGSLDRVLD